MYKPPPSSWHLPVFIKASLKDIRATVVSCGTCPVSLPCLSSTKGEAPGGTGYVCKKCGATAVYVDEPDVGKTADDILVLDCGQHNFEIKKGNGLNTLCALCTGGVMELYVRGKGAVNHYIVTEHARVDVETRQKVLREQFEYWTKKCAKEKTTK